MKIVGTIVEYNPLHNGHIYAINKIKEESNADAIIAVMSSNFTMRGDLSIFNKFHKTIQSLNAGIDIVIELPFCYTLHNSDLFAKHAIYLLNLAKIDEVWIGSEQNNPQIYEQAYHEFNKPENQEKIKKYLDEGLSYKMATNAIFSLPANDLLGYSYYKAIKDLNLNIKLKTIKRIGANYHDQTPNIYASAFAIRNNKSLAQNYCPEYIDINSSLEYNQLFPYLKYQIQTKSINDLKKIFLVTEGIENKLKNIDNFNNIDDFINSLVTKRYTKSRIQRILAYVLFNITKDDMEIALNNLPNFIRILGYSNIGNTYIKQIKKDVNILTNIKHNIHISLDIEMKVSTILDTIYNTDNKINEQSKPITK